MLNHRIVRCGGQGLLPHNGSVDPDQAYFWAAQQGVELDLLLFKDGRRQRMDAPKLTPSMRIALEDLHLEQLVVLYPGTRRYALSERLAVVPLDVLTEGNWKQIFSRHTHTPRKSRKSRG